MKTALQKACILLLLYLPFVVNGSSTTGPFGVTSISESNASSCTATDGSFDLELDASNLGVSPYDISIDNGSTWLVNNQVPTMNTLTASGLQWGTYTIAVRDANGDVLYPGYAVVQGCTQNLPASASETFSIGAIAGATVYTWTSTIGILTGGQNTTSGTFDFSAEAINASGKICVLPIGPTCAAPATCFDVLIAGTISGTVYEDINYGGGSGRNFVTANTSAQASGWNNQDVGVENARVELYTAAGVYLDATLTDVNGDYQFAGVGSGTYQVRFATRTVTSNRGSNSTGVTAYAVPTYRSVGATAFANEIGGADPTKEDAAPNTTSLNVSALNTASTVAQAISSVTLSGSSMADVDLGLSFNVITNTNSSGIGSVRGFIDNSNELDNVNIDLEDNPSGRPVLAKPAGHDVSVFEIPGAGPHTITLLTELPDIRDEFTHITGNTQQGSVQGRPENRTISVFLTSNSGTFDGLRIRGNNTTVSGLALGNFEDAIAVLSYWAENLFVWGNFVGLEADGITISANTSSAVLAGYHVDPVVGTNGDGVLDENEGNVLSNSYEGVNLKNSRGGLVAGNYIGLDHTGMTISGQRYYGVSLSSCTGRNVVGLDDQIPTLTPSAARNIIGGNGTDGVRVSNSDDQVIAGNYLGTDRLGTSPLKNSGYGVQLIGSVSNTQVGTNSNGVRDIEERNIISGNLAGFRTLSGGTGSDNWIAGNYIGVDVTGNVALPNENNGLDMSGSQVNSIIGTNADGVRDAIERNVISGNVEDGIRLAGAGGNRVSGNYIGVGVDGVTSIPNGKRGIIIATTSANNIVGWSTSFINANPDEVGNIIRGNSGTGVALSGTGTNNRLSKNNYGDNGGLAIDLEYDLVTVNDNGDGDSGPNNLLNYPVLSYSKLTPTGFIVKGFAPLGSTVEFYIADGGDNPSPLPSGYTSSFGEGQTYLGESREGSAQDNDATTGTYTDDGSGAITTKSQQKFNFIIPIASLNVAIIPGNELTAIAIDATGNTSEFGGRIPIRVVEICDDLIDNDGDGLVDCDDDDCPNANPVATVSN